MKPKANDVIPTNKKIIIEELTKHRISIKMNICSVKFNQKINFTCTLRGKEFLATSSSRNGIFKAVAILEMHKHMRKIQNYEEKIDEAMCIGSPYHRPFRAPCAVQ